MIVFGAFARLLLNVAIGIETRRSGEDLRLQDLFLAEGMEGCVRGRSETAELMLAKRWEHCLAHLLRRTAKSDVRKGTGLAVPESSADGMASATEVRFLNSWGPRMVALPDRYFYCSAHR